MKYLLPILMMLLFGCSSGPKQKDGKLFTDTLQQKTGKVSQFILAATNNCSLTNISKQFDIEINFKRFTDTIKQQDSCFLVVFIKDKASMILDSIHINPPSIFDHFSSCDSMTSYSTGLNSTRQIADNYFGDIVIADLNFDGRDDMAIINDNGGNGGPAYLYFIQVRYGAFVPDDFLTDSVTYFPSKFDRVKQRLITYVNAGACCVGEHIYQFDKANNKWRQISHKILGKRK